MEILRRGTLGGMGQGGARGRGKGSRMVTMQRFRGAELRGVAGLEKAGALRAHEYLQLSLRKRGSVCGEAAHGPRLDRMGRVGAKVATILSVPRAQAGHRSGSRPVQLLPGLGWRLQRLGGEGRTESESDLRDSGATVGIGEEPIVAQSDETLGQHV
jgi:hypothetical protein